MSTPLPPLTDDARHIRDELIAAQPDEGEVLLDWDDPDGPGGMFEAAARVLDDAGVQIIRQLRREIFPRTAVDNLPIWERSLGLSEGRTALNGTVEQRQAQAVSKLRERGAPTLQRIRDVINAYLRYTNVMSIQIIEVDRDVLRAAHTYTWRGGAVISGAATYFYFDVPDDGYVAEPGAQVDFDITTSDLGLLYVAVTAPDGSSGYVGNFTSGLAGRGTVTSAMQFTPSTVGFTVRAFTNMGSAYPTWAVGDGGHISKWDGTSWNAEVSGTTNRLNAVSGIKYTSLGFTYRFLIAVGDSGLILLGNGNTGAWTPYSPGTLENFTGVSYRTSTEAMVVGTNWVVFIMTGGAWSFSAPPAGATGDATCVTHIGADYIVCDTAGFVYQWTAGAWNTILWTGGTSIRAVWAASATDLWIVGDGGFVAHLTRSGWTAPTILPGAPNLRSVFGDGSIGADGMCNSVWAVGDGGVIFYWNGAAWTAYGSPTVSNLYACSGTSMTDVWIGGVEAAHLDGKTGTPLRLYFPALAGKQINGRWSVAVTSSTTSAINRVALFVEGLGIGGRGGVKFMWGVAVDPALLGAGYDLEAAQAAIDRMCYATRQGVLVGTVASSLGAAIPDTASATPDLAIPGP